MMLNKGSKPTKQKLKTTIAEARKNKQVAGYIAGGTHQAANQKLKKKQELTQ
jgi:hypothetical protein